MSAAALNLYDSFNVGLIPFWHFQCGLGEGSIALSMWLSQIFAQAALLGDLIVMSMSVYTQCSRAEDVLCSGHFLHCAKYQARVGLLSHRVFPSLLHNVHRNTTCSIDLAMVRIGVSGSFVLFQPFDMLDQCDA